MELTHSGYITSIHVFTILIVLANVNSKPWQPVTVPKIFTGSFPKIKNTLPTVFQTCGKSISKKSRLILGANATLGEWPWQVAIYYGNSFLCGGILIDSLNVLTAAHCMDQVDIGYITVVLGDYNVGINNADIGEQKLRISKYVNHNEYDFPTPYTNDISIVHLERPVMFTQFVQPVCLPEFKRDPKIGRKCFVTGWGNTVLNGFQMSIVLQQIPLNILSWKDCNAKNRKIASITTSMFCGANILPKITNHSACHGDSGGPLVCLDNNGSWVVHGIVSWGSAACDTSDAYTVFAKVSQFVDWIFYHKRKSVINKSVVS